MQREIIVELWIVIACCFASKKKILLGYLFGLVHVEKGKKRTGRREQRADRRGEKKAGRAKGKSSDDPLSIINLGTSYSLSPLLSCPDRVDIPFEMGSFAHRL